mmetsp:Transcript_12117/g.38723  ORF Transcript_12117/g.38723 Transcript_12117/m.38723 type:complete len:228 (-) Transcript_12117:978-1661(-)
MGTACAVRVLAIVANATRTDVARGTTRDVKEELEDQVHGGKDEDDEPGRPVGQQVLPRLGHPPVGCGRAARAAAALVVLVAQVGRANRGCRVASLPGRPIVVSQRALLLHILLHRQRLAAHALRRQHGQRAASCAPDGPETRRTPRGDQYVHQRAHREGDAEVLQHARDAPMVQVKAIVEEQAEREQRHTAADHLDGQVTRGTFRAIRIGDSSFLSPARERSKRQNH